MDPPVQNKQIQYWTTNICGHDCKSECIEGKKNVSADIMSHLPHRPSCSNDGNRCSGLDITDKSFEATMINNSNIYPKVFVQYDHQIKDKQCTKGEVNLPGYDLITEQTKDKELLKLKEELKSGRVS